LREKGDLPERGHLPAIADGTAGGKTHAKGRNCEEGTLKTIENRLRRTLKRGDWKQKEQRKTKKQPKIGRFS
jgi:hypothetical protein